jgi:hypothetical protein
MARVVDSAAVLKHFSLGPVLSPRVDAAYATEPLKRSSWQHGLVVAAQAFEDPRSGYGALQVFLGAGVGVVAGVALTGLPLYLQFVIGGVAGLATYWAVPTAWAVVAWLRAPRVQRDQAREYARALETHVHEYAEWARRREIAEDFRRETLEFARSVSEGNWHQSASDLDMHWRGNAGAVQGQLREHGADGDVTGEIDRQLAALDAKEDGYGDDEIRRIVNNMQTACQNVWTMTRAHDTPPIAPNPPASQREKRRSQGKGRTAERAYRPSLAQLEEDR